MIHFSTVNPVRILGNFIPYSVQAVDLIWQEQRQLDASVLGVQQVDGISGGGRGVGGVRGQGRGGAAGEVRLP